MLDYTNYDYQALVDRMTEILKDADGWGDAYQSSTGQTLIQLMADVTDHLHYMLERRTLESFLETAKLRSSIVARASDLGYRPERIKSHTGTLEVTLVDDNGDPTPAVGEVNLAAMKGITYEGIDSGKHWARIDTYGPKLVENIVQATARDLLAEAMLAADAAGYPIVMHCHDELIVEAPIGHGSLTALCNLMGIAPAWAKGLPLRADGYECDYYRKD